MASPENWRNLSRELAKINNKSPYLKFSNANFYTSTSFEYRTLHHTYNSIKKALKKEPDNFLFRLKKLEIQFSVIALRKFEKPEFADFCKELNSNLELILDNEDYSDMKIYYANTLADGIDVVRDNCFRIGLVKKFREWTVLQKMARGRLRS